MFASTHGWAIFDGVLIIVGGAIAIWALRKIASLRPSNGERKAQQERANAERFRLEVQKALAASDEMHAFRRALQDLQDQSSTIRRNVSSLEDHCNNTRRSLSNLESQSATTEVDVRALRTSVHSLSLRIQELEGDAA